MSTPPSPSGLIAANDEMVASEYDTKRIKAPPDYVRSSGYSGSSILRRSGPPLTQISHHLLSVQLVFQLFLAKNPDFPTNQFDFVFARFGTMFFANPVAGLRNMRRALKPGGRMVHIVWRERADNPWLSMARDVVLRFLPPPGDEAQTCGPGPFSMSDETVVRAMMKSAGYEQVELRRVDAPVLVGKDVKDAIAFQLAIGPAGEVFREAGPEAERKRPEIEAALEEAINRQKIAAEGIVMDSSSWVISAINPA